MPTQTAKPSPEGYKQDTLRPLNCLVFILPMLLIFQVGTGLYGTNLLAPQHLHKLLKYFGATAIYLPAVFLVVVLLAQHLLHKDPWDLHPKVFAGMFGESILWMIPLIVMARLSGHLVSNEALAANYQFRDTFQKVLLAFGAGIYEEFIFRLAFVSLVMMIFVDIFAIKKKEAVAVTAVILGGAIFSLYHLSAGELADWARFPWGNFIFRWLAGVYLGMLFVFRGYGIAVGAHAFYNIYAALAVTAAAAP